MCLLDSSYNFFDIIIEYTCFCAIDPNRRKEYVESVSKMLGHKDLRTTQHYAKIVDRKISDDMKALRKILEEKAANDSDKKNSKKK